MNEQINIERKKGSREERKKERRKEGRKEGKKERKRERKKERPRKSICTPKDVFTVFSYKIFPKSSTKGGRGLGPMGPSSNPSK